MNIPKIIHQTWKTTDIPDEFVEYSNSWKRDYPDYTYILWTDENNRNLIKDKYEWFLETYDNYPNNIQRADAVRYFILLTYGGIYVDLDIESFKKFNFDGSIYFSLEHKSHNKIHNKNAIISNALMASVEKHPFLYSVVNNLKKHCHKDILNSTGPFMITDTYNSFVNKEDITILPYKHFFPLNYLDCEKEVDKSKLDSYGLHYHAGTWWKKNVKDKIREKMPTDYGEIYTNFKNEDTSKIGLVITSYKRPEYLERMLKSLEKSILKDTIICIIDESLPRKPKKYTYTEIGNYHKYIGLNSIGYNIKKVSGNINNVMNKCNVDNKSVGFNSEGYLKYEVDPHKIVRKDTTLYLKKNVKYTEDTIEDIMINSKTREIIKEFDINGVRIIKIFKNNHSNMYNSLSVGWFILSDVFKCKYLCNLDSDVIVKKKWLNVLKNTYKMSKKTFKIATGFNTKNHKTIMRMPKHILKFDIGGINMFFNYQTYTQIIKFYLNTILWDYVVCEKIRRVGGDIICSKPSVVQHIGKEGLWSNGKKYDKAKDF